MSRRQTLMVCSVVFLSTVSFLLRTPCLGQEVATWARLVPGCEGDLHIMWNQRGLRDHVVPYLQPFSNPVTGKMTTVEYPVLVGMLMWVFSLPGSYVGFLILSTALMAAAAVAIALVLEHHCGRGAWFWAASPVLVHYVTYNYDMLPALATAVAIALVLGQDPTQVSSARYLGAAVALGVGGALKLYPLLLAVSLTMWLLFGRRGLHQLPRRQRFGRGLGAAGATAGVFVLVNLPFVLANPSGWLLPFTFQATRPIDVTTISLWYFLGWAMPWVSGPTWMAVAAGATAAAILLAAGIGWWAGYRQGGFALVESMISLLAVYLAFNKVYSPQYAVWLLPLLILARSEGSLLKVLHLSDIVLFWSFGVMIFANFAGLGNLGVAGACAFLMAAMLRLLYTLYLALLSLRAPGSNPKPSTSTTSNDGNSTPTLDSSLSPV